MGAAGGPSRHQRLCAAYAPGLFFLGPAGGHFSTARSASLLLQGGCATICAAYIYIYIYIYTFDFPAFFWGMRHDMRRIYIYIYIYMRFRHFWSQGAAPRYAPHIYIYMRFQHPRACRVTRLTLFACYFLLGRGHIYIYIYMYMPS